MSSRQNFTQKLLNLPLSILVKSANIPSDPIEDLNIDIERPIFYALPFNSNVDLITLSMQTKKLGLPNPFSQVEINGQTFDRYVVIGSQDTQVAKELAHQTQSRVLFTKLLQLHDADPDLDVQIIPTTVLWGRKPGVEGKQKTYLEKLSSTQKGMKVIRAGRDCMVRFSPCVSLRYMADVHGTDETIAHKLARVSRIHFSRQKIAASGPNLPERDVLFERLMTSEAIKSAIENEATSKNISVDKARSEAHKILDEIAANFSYSLVKQGDIVLSWLWNRLYQGININNASTVRKLAQDGHEIVYVPCHRSHMDYLLLSYVLYKEGMVPPHIAAGINLDFFPAGPIFRRGGAFFIRRSFKGNKLYSTIFREYLAELFSKGYSVEYFSEGGRSRTGRLLQAKTGMLAMTIQAMLRGLDRPVTLVPVYIGYEHVMEVTTYAKELQGKRKEKENAGQVLRTLRKLRNFGKGYVNFGEPIPLNQFLNDQAPEWKKFDGASKPQWMTPVVNKLANKMMTNINSAAAPNALTLCATALLASRQRALSKETLISQLDCYLTLLKKSPYSDESTIPKESATELVEHAIALNKFIIDKDSMGEIISLDRQQSVLMTYYRNNIIHVLALPSLVAHMAVLKEGLTKAEITQAMTKLYPFLKKELFIRYETSEIDDVVEDILNSMQAMSLIDIKDDKILHNAANIQTLILLSRTISETLQRYAIAFAVLDAHPLLEMSEIESRSQDVAQRLGRLHGINAPEFFDKGVFAFLSNTLVEEEYFDREKGGDRERIHQLSTQLMQMLTAEVRLTILESID